MSEMTSNQNMSIVILLLVLAVACILLTFATIGTKSLLRELISQVRKTNDLLQRTIAPGRGEAITQQGREREPTSEGHLAEELIDRIERPFITFAFTAPVVSVGVAIVVLVVLVIAYALWQ